MLTLREANQAKDAREESLLASLVAALGNREPAGGAPDVQITQHIYANATSYAAQQRPAIGRALFMPSERRPPMKKLETLTYESALGESVTFSHADTFCPQEVKV